jgi:hypothetical protein
VKRATGEERGGIEGARGGMRRDQRSDCAVLDPVMKGRVAWGESKNISMIYIQVKFYITYPDSAL